MAETFKGCMLITYILCGKAYKVKKPYYCINVLLDDYI